MLKSEIFGLKYRSLDTETHLIGRGQIIPPLVCLTTAVPDIPGAEIYTPWDHPELESLVRSWLKDKTTVIVTANGSYDACVLVREYPSLLPDFFDCYEDGRYVDLQIREKLMDLSVTGDIITKRYSLNALGQNYALEDRSDQKTGDNIWRLRYSELSDVPVESWPRDARDYALEDAVETLRVAQLQDERIAQSTYCQDITLGLHSASAFALNLVTARGMWTDPDRVDALSEILDDLLDDGRMALLFEAGILRPAVAPRIYKNGNGITKGKPVTKNAKVLREYFEAGFKKLGEKPPETDTGLIATGAAALSKLMSKVSDPVLECWAKRQSVEKLRSTYLPHLREGIVYANFDYLKATGRCSSVSSKLYPSVNGQNLPRVTGRLSIRECLVPRPGFLFASIDYSGLELCSAGQVLKNIVGYSTLLDRINAGIDNHAFLGAQIAHKWDVNFSNACARLGVEYPEDIYDAFMAMKETDKKTWKHYRTFAKPTGLGYPGGLGAATFVEFARTTYGVEVSLAQAEELRDLWHATYPEWREYFAWVNVQADPCNLGELHYYTPKGMRRANTTYCQTANGNALQSPAAEGMKLAHWNVTRATWEVGRGSIAFGCRTVNVIHDELLLEVPDDALASDKVKEVQRIMEESMTACLPDAKISTEAALMRRWYKQAEPVFDNNHNLIPWDPTHQEKI